MGQNIVGVFVHHILVVKWTPIYWESMENYITASTKACLTGQKLRNKGRSEVNYHKKIYQWYLVRLYVLIWYVGPYTITDKLSNDRIPHTMTFVDPATGWFEIAEILDKSRAQISHIFGSTWPAHYTGPR